MCIIWNNISMFVFGSCDSLHCVATTWIKGNL
ncbi:hypothetical protein CUMW_253050 [Citrus unshiu]|uniref:Uncharacterized protein n=1 Tax=Citrus unshiu TaxID=55188 RepID=A0A2H5QQS6_CITUN|nr:hypothetical protein CUMW_253050 [Citrus unshiu]